MHDEQDKGLDGNASWQNNDDDDNNDNKNITTNNNDDDGRTTPPYLDEEEDDDDDDESVSKSEYDIHPNPKADHVDLSELRGVASKEKKNPDNTSENELEALAELVPDLKARRHNHHDDLLHSAGMTTEDVDLHPIISHSATPFPEDDEVEVVAEDKVYGGKPNKTMGGPSATAVDLDEQRQLNDLILRSESMMAQNDGDDESGKLVQAALARNRNLQPRALNHQKFQPDGGTSLRHGGIRNIPEEDDENFDEYPHSDHALEDEAIVPVSEPKVPKEFINMSSGQSISTATQTHEVRMPMYLPTFKPATGCTNASDFIVRCFVARLRSGITVVKHGRSRWCKSRLRVLHIHPDGRSLSWKPAEGEPTSSKRPPKLDLSTCLEVRHAWSPDPQNPMYTGTPILRQKCEAANAHKSFALIFKQRTVDITAVTADQCKVLMEGFSALCFRLQVASIAGRGGAKKAHARPMPEEDGVSLTASATLTNNSTPRGGLR